MSLPKYLLVVSVTVDPSVEDDWNKWYDDVHLPEIVACPGFQRCARYVGGEADRSYMTVYEIDGPSALESVEFSQRRGWFVFKDKVKPSVRMYRQITELQANASR